VPRRAVRRSGMNTLDLMWVVCGTVLPSFLISWSAVRYVRRLAIRWQLVDRPGTRKVHTTPTPMGGGLAIWLGVVLPFAVGQLIVWLLTSNSQAASWLNPVIPAFARPHLAGLAHQAASLWVLLGGGTLLLIVGLVDDRFGISWRLRLGLQCVVATVCVLWQGWRLTAFIDVPWITWGLSVIWIVGLINSFNMLDNMDGLSAGVAAIAATMLAVVLFVTPDAQTRQPQIFVAGFLFVIVGALLGFLWHNRPPARIFMGDAGSYFVGHVHPVPRDPSACGPCAALCHGRAVVRYDQRDLDSIAGRTQPISGRQEPFLASPCRSRADQRASRSDHLPDHGDMRSRRLAVAPG
jgi:UDP-GlcNAc:undecaprenyl-phosphate GlcNAc-1-phosphate transferase